MVPDVPQGLSASVSDDHAILTWTAETGLDYEVQYALDAGLSGARDAWSGTGGKIELGPYAAGDIWFRIRARQGTDDHPGPWSPVARVPFPPDKESSSPPVEPEKDALVPEKEIPAPAKETATPPEPAADDPQPKVEKPAEANPSAPVEESTPTPPG
jgi:hypothetical protein